VAYETFQRKSIRVDIPTLSIVPDGRVAINAAACRLLIAAGVKTVMILWDKAAGKMAVKAAPKGEKNTFTITFAEDHHSGSFAAKSFLRHIGWNAPTRIMVQTAWSEKDKMFEVVLPSQFLTSGATEAKKRIKVI
jgi:hypothetical protein